MTAELDVKHIRNEIRTTGYVVVDGLVDEDDVHSMREFWLDEFSRPVDRAPLIWGPYLGEPNRKIFDTRETHNLYRAFDFLWNEPYHPLTRRLALDLSRKRNQIIGCDERDGEFFEPGRYGIYVTTSFYPCGTGWLEQHQDEMDGRDHWHFILPLTFRGADYATGGLRLLDRGGDVVDVEDMLKPGSVVFYDGILPHWVDLIEGGPERGCGRLQMFAIPVRFAMPHESDRIGAELPLRKVLRSKASRLKWRLMGKLGR